MISGKTSLQQKWVLEADTIHFYTSTNTDHTFEMWRAQFKRAWCMLSKIWQKILRLVFDPISVSDKKEILYTVLTTYKAYVIGLCKNNPKHAMH